MESSFERILAQLRGDEVDPIPDATTASSSLNENDDVNPITEKPLSLALNMPVTNDMAQTLGEALLNSDHDVCDIKLQLFWMSPHPTAYGSLLRFLRTSGTLRTVSLFGNPTGNPGCRGMAEWILRAIAENEHIQELNLAWIELSRASIACQRHTKELILIRSTFVDYETDENEEGIGTFAAAEEPSKLRSLVIDVWDQDSIATLAGIGTYHTSVNTLYVRYPLTMVAVQPVIDFIRLQTSLKEVLLRNCGTDLSDMMLIVNALPEATTTVEVVNGYWDSPEMCNLANSPDDLLFQAHKTCMIQDMARTNSLIMLHCYVTTTSRKRDSLFTKAEEEVIKATGSRNYILPVLMRGSNVLWDNTANWPTMLALGVHIEHPIHFSLLFEVVRDRLMQCPPRKRTIQQPAAAVENTTPVPRYRRFMAWIRRRRLRC